MAPNEHQIALNQLKKMVSNVVLAIFVSEYLDRSFF